MMKAFVAGLVAVGILYAADHQYNDDRYTRVIEQALTGLIFR
jgi:hypothetical protein